MQKDEEQLLEQDIKKFLEEKEKIFLSAFLHPDWLQRIWSRA